MRANTNSPIPPSCVAGFGSSELLLGALFQVSWLFEDILESSRAIGSVALRIAYQFYYIRAFQSFDGALRGRKRNRQFVRHAFCNDDRICPHESDRTQRVVARFSGDFPLPLGQ